ncbi:MAG TPA: hypothetical protein VFQ76_09595 [Longimicrobiaceae bacterium]|nr:hypothetical protein [Longimicrobiaceae bacterium]
MLRSALATLVILLAAAGGLAAQGGEVGVSLTIVEPLALSAAPRAASTIRHRAGEFVEVAMPLELAGSASQIVAVAAAAGEAGSPGFRVRGASGGFEPLSDGRPVALGTSGKVGRSTPARAVYRLDLQGRPAPRDLRLTVSYVIAPDA